jgi:hypothetical protein
MSEHETAAHRAHRMLSESGYANHPDAAEDARLIRHMVKPKALKRARGGHVDGMEPKGRPDKRARGGKTVININAGKGDDGQDAAMQAHQAGMQQGAQMGARAVMQKLQAAQQGGGGAGPGAAPGGPGAPMAGPAPGGPAPGAAGAPPGMPPRPGMGAKNGGSIYRARGGSVDDKKGEPPLNLRSERFSGADEQHMPKYTENDTVTVREHQRRKSGGRCE